MGHAVIGGASRVGGDTRLTLEAARCEGCVDWLGVCDAECCRGFNIWLADEGDAVTDGADIRVRMRGLGTDVRHYYELHGARYIGGNSCSPRAGAHCTPTSGSR